MKKTLSIGCILVSAIFFTSCEEKPTENIIVENLNYDEYYEFQDFILSDFDLTNVSISLPDETANIGAVVEPSVIHDEAHKWQISVGPKFELHIEDQGELQDLIQEKKDELSREIFSKITYIEESDSMLVYEKELIPTGISSASKDVGTEHKAYHIFGVQKVGEFNYTLHSGLDGVQSTDILELMKKSIRSFKKFK